MSEKRFKIRYGTISTNYPSGRIFDNKKQHSLYLDEVVDLLNEQQATINKLKEENEQLKQKIQRWKTLYEIKDKEVTARVDALNEVCEYYLTEAQFKADTDPNEAVHEVINRILNTEVKW